MRIAFGKKMSSHGPLSLAENTTQEATERMKILVQNPLTLSYLQDNQHWTNNPDQASAFTNSQSAITFCREHDLAEMQIVLKFPDDRYDVQMPVDFDAASNRRKDIQERTEEMMG